MNNSAAISCDQLDDIDNGDVDQANPALVGSVAVYTCSRGFRLVGASRRVCQRDGSYTEEEPVCVGKDDYSQLHKTPSVDVDRCSYCVWAT